VAELGCGVICDGRRVAGGWVARGRLQTPAGRGRSPTSRSRRSPRPFWKRNALRRLMYGRSYRTSFKISLSHGCLVPGLCQDHFATDAGPWVLWRQMKTSAVIAAHAPPAFLTEKQLAARWQVTPKTIQRMVRRGELPSIVVSRSPRFPLAEIEKYEAGSASFTSVASPNSTGTGPGEHLDVELPPRLPERTYFSVCIAHRKGGVAKTTTVWYLGRELARAGKRVLLTDLDPQRGLFDIFRDHGCEDGRFSSRLVLADDEGATPFTPEMEIIDTPPALDDSLPGVERSDAVIVPTVPEHQAVRALERMLLVLEDTRRKRPFVRNLGILPVRVKSRWPEHAAFLEQIATLASRFGCPMLPPVMESRAVLTYSLRGRLWRPVADRLLLAASESGYGS
jgi:cellulose biosynthesis protein BcsQ